MRWLLVNAERAGGLQSTQDLIKILNEASQGGLLIMVQLDYASSTLFFK